MVVQKVVKSVTTGEAETIGKTMTVVMTTSTDESAGPSLTPKLMGPPGLMLLTERERTEGTVDSETSPLTVVLPSMVLTSVEVSSALNSTTEEAEGRVR